MNRWLKQAYEKLTVLHKHAATGTDLELTPLEFRAVCADLGIRHRALGEAAEDLGLSKLAATALALEKVAFDPLLLALGAGAGGSAILGGGKLYNAIRKSRKKVMPDKARFGISKWLNKLPEADREKALRDVAAVHKIGPIASKSPLNWAGKDWRNALLAGGGLAGGGYLLGNRKSDSSPNMIIT